ncbi:MAG TPA: FlgD immunoglobulin-like domain containing protein [Candidatus Udaeobacter sp.]|nr:FlgD immunoglobulin-like domain containing protein [Candidatus Udaeobacter sp.]
MTRLLQAGVGRGLPRERRLAAAIVLLVALQPVRPAAALCPEEPPLQNYTGAGQTVCPCFVPGEEAGAVLNAPSQHYPIEILRVAIAWGSLTGGAPQQIEEAIHIYGAGLPNPGTPIFTLPGPQLTDGFINQFNLEPLPGEIVVNSGPFTVTLEFANQNAGDPFAPSMVHDGNGCQPGKNVVFAIPAGWRDGCSLGLSGDWVVFAVYRRVNCATGVEEEYVAQSGPIVLLQSRPNPFQLSTEVNFLLGEEQQVQVTVHDLAGRLVDVLASRVFPSGRHALRWDGRAADGTAVAPGVYFLAVDGGPFHANQKLVLRR